MKVLDLTAVLVLAAAIQTAQDMPASSDPPGVTVSSTSWHREVRNPDLLKDPMTANQRSPSDRAQTDANPDAGKVPANRLLFPETLKEPKPQTSKDPAVQYVYEIRLLNNGPRTIRRIVWDFDLLEPDTKRQVGHHTFTSVRTIRSGQSTRLVERSTRNPISLVDVKQVGREGTQQYEVRVTINRIEYDHGSAWVRNSN